MGIYLLIYFNLFIWKSLVNLVASLIFNSTFSEHKSQYLWSLTAYFWSAKQK